jgi:arylformamidase
VTELVDLSHRLEMVGNTGTYLDSPFHRYANGKDSSQLPLTSILWSHE